jgi:hypothetical protein
MGNPLRLGSWTMVDRFGLATLATGGSYRPDNGLIRLGRDGELHGQGVAS